jgi:hypothetical protein
MSSSQIQKRIQAGLKRAQKKTGSVTSDKVYLVVESGGNNDPLNPIAPTKSNVELTNAIFINYDAKLFSSTILAGDRKLICDNVNMVKQGDVIIQGVLTYVVVGMEIIAPTSDTLAYMPQVRLK